MKTEVAKQKKSVAIVGGGASALFAASFLDPNIFDTTIYEQNKTLGKKLLLAGKGGLNLTHSEALDLFITRYTPSSFLEKTLHNFDNKDLQNWFSQRGIPTFVGSSKRVYPEKNIRPQQVLAQLLSGLQDKGVEVRYKQQWTGWQEAKKLTFNNSQTVCADYIIFALGGGSWKTTGSDGNWISYFEQQGIGTHPFFPSNCAYQVDWEADFIVKNEGQPLKNIALTCGKTTTKGEIVLTQFGIEGNAIYALSPSIRTAFQQLGHAPISIDLKPMLTQEEVLGKLSNSSKTTTNCLRQELKLDKTQIALLKAFSNKEEFTNPLTLSSKIKKLPLQIVAAGSINRAISTVGGVDLEEVSPFFELKKYPAHFCVGEMLDWDAPTGGYLLQACFSMGVWVAQHLNRIETENKK